MIQFFEKFFAQKNQSVIGIDIGSSSIKVVQLRKKGAQAVLETYGELSLGPYAGVSVGQATNVSEDIVAQALADLLGQKEVGITTPLCAVAIPFSSSLMSVVEMPNVPPKELAGMIPIEARKYIPVPISEVSLDWSVIPRDTTNQEAFVPQIGQQASGDAQEKKAPSIDVLLVAIHNDTLARYTHIVKKNNLDAGFFEIEIFSSMRAVIDQTIQPIMIFDIGAATTKLFIVERGILRSSHTINRGSQTITAAISKSLGIPIDQAEVMKRQYGLLDTSEKGLVVANSISLTLEYIFTEANRVIFAYEKKYNKNINKILLVGGGSSLRGIKDIAQKSFQTDVFPGDPFSKVVTPAFLDDVLKETGPQFTVALGLALRRLEELG
jgi:type IV pilus assembly protein PilM